MDSGRIAVAGGSLTEIIYFLGAEERIVAVDVTSTYPAPDRHPSVGYVRDLSSEGLLSMRPTLVLGEDDMGPPEVLTAVRRAGVAVMRVPETHSAAGIVAKVVDASIVEAPSSTKNRSGERDPEMRQTKEGEPVALRDEDARGVGRGDGDRHSFAATPANESDVAHAHRLPRGGEKRAWGDAGYRGEARGEPRRRRGVAGGDAPRQEAAVGTRTATRSAGRRRRRRSAIVCLLGDLGASTGSHRVRRDALGRLW